jgi:hypothetical protein
MKAKLIFFVILLFLGGLTAIISCSDDPQEPLNSENDILSFSFPEETGAADIDNDNHTIAIEVEYGTDLAFLTPTFTLSEGASSDPASGTVGDYSSVVTITVRAEDGTTTQDWTIEVTEASPEPSSAADVLDFAVTEQTQLPTIDNVNNSIAVEVANGTDLTTLAPVLTISPGATSDPASGETGDYSSAKVIEVTAEDGATVESWTVNVSERPASGGPPSSATEILTFTIPDVTHHTHIRDGYQVVVFLEEDSDLTNSAATFTLSPGATANPPSGTPRDYSSTELIVVTAEDGVTKETWQVMVFDGIDAEEVCYEVARCQDEESMNACIIAYNECIARYGKDQTKACALAADIVCELGESND